MGTRMKFIVPHVAGDGDSRVGGSARWHGNRFALWVGLRHPTEAAASDLLTRYSSASEIQMFELPSAGGRRIRKKRTGT
jgi:hypothetical protein